MFLSIDKSSKVPVYIQIRDRIVEMVQSGALQVGDKLPGTRDLAKQLGVSRKTVLQAYLELAADSWVESRPGSCTYILDRSKLVGNPLRESPSIEVMPPPDNQNHALMDWSPFQLDSRFSGMPIVWRQRFAGITSVT